MTANPESAKYNSDRGVRLKKELQRIFHGLTSENSIAEAFKEKTGGFCTTHSIKNWMKGNDIDCRALAHLAEMGGDLFYILTGTPATHPTATVGTDESHAHFANLVGLLAEGEMRSMANPELYQGWLSFCAQVNADLLELMHTMRGEEQEEAQPPTAQNQAGA